MSDNDNPIPTFKDAPLSIGEHRTSKSHSPNDWTVRDMLINMLRKIDNNELKIENAIICFTDTRDEDDDTVSSGYVQAGKSIVNIALLSLTATRLGRTDGDA